MSNRGVCTSLVAALALAAALSSPNVVNADIPVIDISELFAKRIDARSPQVAHVVAAIGTACEEVRQF